MGRKIVLNETSYFGRNSRENLLPELKQRGFKKALVVTDQALQETKVTNLVTSILDKGNFDYEIFSDIKPNPNITNVKTGLDVCRQSKADVIIAVGGGSVIDTAKCISIIMTNEEYEDVISLDGVVTTKNKGMPLIALPTTSGTAAEVTINYVITDDERNKKMVCVDPHDIPIIAIVDQDLMAKMPKSLAAATGMDALTHAIEGYLTKGAWLMTDMFHLNAMSLIYQNLEKAVNEKDEEAIDNVGYGQYIAGMGFSNAGLGIVHSMAHSLGSYYDTPHGLANALLLPHVLKFNAEECPELFRNIATSFGLNIVGKTDKHIVDMVITAIKTLSIKIGLPQTLKDIGIKENDLPKLAHQAINDICTAGNPRDVTEEDILNIYTEAYY